MLGLAMDAVVGAGKETDNGDQGAHHR
jgi:hypothetical protein